ncbi:hypothetical protein N9413_12750, partial [Paracoccaceae bacterium]|nr:hypothetical protein [Paracoccaceae bacterium]
MAYISPSENDTFVIGTPSEDDISIYADKSYTVDGGGGWDSLEIITDRQDIRLQIFEDEGGSGYVKTIDSSGSIAETLYDDIQRIVLNEHVGVDYFAGDDGSYIKLKILDEGFDGQSINLNGSKSEDRLLLHGLAGRDLDGDYYDLSTFDTFSQHYEFKLVENSLANFELLRLEDDAVIANISDFDIVRFQDNHYGLYDVATNVTSGLDFYGDDQDNRIVGTSYNDVIYSGDGSDNVDGGHGNDTIYAHDLDNPTDQSEWNNIVGGPGSDVIYFKNPGSSPVGSTSGVFGSGTAVYFVDGGISSLSFDPIGHTIGYALTGDYDGDVFSATFGTHGSQDDRAIFFSLGGEDASTDTLIMPAMVEVFFSGDEVDPGGKLELSIDWSDELITPYIIVEGGENDISGSDADDYLSDFATNDFIYALAGDDIIDLWNGGHDTVFSGDGDDRIHPDAWQIIDDRDSSSYIDGGAGSDTIFIDTIPGAPEAGSFNLARLDPENGFDVFRVSVNPFDAQSSDGYDSTRDYTVYLETDLDPLTSTRSGYVTFTDQPDIRITEFDNVESLQFNQENDLDSDRWVGFELTGNDIVASAKKDGVVVPYIYGTDGNESLFGSEDAEVIFGYAGDDSLDGAGGNDR